MLKFANKIDLLRALAGNYQIIKAKPAVNLFFLQYLKKFRVLDVGGHQVIHSHLPPINSKAYARFINEHLLAKSTGPSHAQVGLTNACPQNCEYCYNKNRQGKVMDTETILRLIQDLKRMGVFWLGFTGGEPLLNKDIVRIVASVGEDCASKLFTTGCTLSKNLALDLKNAGLFSVSVSLDHWQAQIHDRGRRYPGAFQAALNAIDIFKSIGGMYVSVSAVLSTDMIRQGQVEEFLAFLTSLEVHEAWLSETKPSVAAFWNDDLIITESERLQLVQLQDRYNKAGKITVNYLGHFEGREHFGCNAGHKMIYVDAFGEVSPCVFTPISFGNVKDKAINDIFQDMHSHFPGENCCFINKNYRLLQKYNGQAMPMKREKTVQMLQEVRFDAQARFFQLHDLKR